jgi:RNA polymerase sigma-70 factor, ECF subfamily
MTEKAEFEAVMRDNGPRIYTLAVGLTGNLTDGQDLMQETFVKAFKHYPEFRGESQVSTWLYRICVNLWKDRLRAQKRHVRRGWFTFTGLSTSEASGPATDEPAIDRNLERSDEQNTLHVALAHLTPEDRAILLWKEVENRPYEEIGRLLDIPMGTVKSRLARAREKLQRAYYKNAYEN